MNLIEAWKKEKGKPFKERLNEEIKSYGQAIVNQYFNNISKLYLISIGKYPASAEEYFEMMMSSSNTIFYMLKEMLPETEDLKKDKERTKRVVDFLLSEKMAEIPSIRLTTQLWSVLADQFSNGGRKIIPGGGIANDVSMVSTILPYCNAMFIDREMHGLLKHPELAKDLKRRYKTEIFSAANKEKFVAYLDNIERTASKAHLDKVKEVYGDDWPRPFTEMYNYEKSQLIT